MLQLKHECDVEETQRGQDSTACEDHRNHKEEMTWDIGPEGRIREMHLNQMEQHKTKLGTSWCVGD